MLSLTRNAAYRDVDSVFSCIMLDPHAEEEEEVEQPRSQALSFTWGWKEEMVLPLWLPLSDWKGLSAVGFENDP